MPAPASRGFGVRTPAGTPLGWLPQFPPVSGADVRVFIAQKNVTGFLVYDSMHIREDHSMRGTMELTLIDPESGYYPECGTEIQVYLNKILIFAGTIDAVKISGSENTREVVSDIEAVDYNQLADRHTVSTIYEQRTLYDIVSDIVDVQSGPEKQRLRDDGVRYSTDTISLDQTRFERLVFDNEFVSDCFDKLADLTGYLWRIDYHKQLYFRESKFFQAPIVFDEHFGNWRGLIAKFDRADYRNVQILRGGKDITPTPITRTFKGDGETQTFTVDLPMAELIELRINGELVPSDQIGISGVDKNKKWYWKRESQEVSQDVKETKLDSDDVLQVKYKGYYDIIQEARDEWEIAERAAKEKTSGVYCDVIEETDIDDEALARERCLGLLKKNSRITSRFEFETMVHGFHVGQELYANYPRFGVIGRYLIDSVEFVALVDDPAYPFLYRIGAIKDHFGVSWVDWYRRLRLKGRPWVHEPEAHIQSIRNFWPKIILGSDPTFSDGDKRPSANNDYSIFAKIGGPFGTPPTYYATCRVGETYSVGAENTVYPVGPLIPATTTDIS